MNVANLVAIRVANNLEILGDHEPREFCDTAGVECPIRFFAGCSYNSLYQSLHTRMIAAEEKEDWDDYEDAELRMMEFVEEFCDLEIWLGREIGEFEY